MVGAVVDRMVVGVGEEVVVPPPVAVVILHLCRTVGGDVDLETVDNGLKQADFINSFPQFTSTTLTSRWPGTW